MCSSDHHVEELRASGSNDVPCTGSHPRLYPRDGHGASDVAMGSNEFPPRLHRLWLFDAFVANIHCDVLDGVRVVRACLAFYFSFA